MGYINDTSMRHRSVIESERFLLVFMFEALLDGVLLLLKNG